MYKNLLSNKNFYSLELEQIILGCLIIYNDSWNNINNFLKIESFYFKNHKIIFSVLLNFLNQNIKFDLNYIYNKIKHFKNFNFYNYIKSIIQKIPDPGQIENYSQILNNMYILRSVLFLIQSLFKNLLKSDNNLNVSKILNNLELNLFNINKNYIINNKNELYSISEIFLKYLNKEILINKEYFLTGYKSMDNIINGFYRGDLIIVAGRPSIGKTSFSLNLIKNISENYKIPTIIFSMEMSSNQLFFKILSLTINENQNKILSSDFKINNNDTNKICSLKIFIDESTNLTISDMYNRCKKIIKNHGELGMVVVDYLQLINFSFNNHHQNRNFEISEISRSLKCMAKEFNVPIIALSQLNRNIESRNSKKPVMSDLRESGCIEQDADVIIFIYKEKLLNSNDNNKNVEISLSKNRKGPTGNFTLNFDSELSKFNEII